MSSIHGSVNHLNALGIILIALVVVVGLGFGFVYVIGPRLLNTSNTNTQPTVILDRAFTLSYGGNYNASESWPFTVTYGETVQIKTVTSGSIYVSTGFSQSQYGGHSYGVGANEGYGNPPDVRSFQISQGGPTYVTVQYDTLSLPNSGECEYSTGGCPIIQGEITVSVI